MPHGTFLGQFCPMGKVAISLTLCKAPGCSSWCCAHRLLFSISVWVLYHSCKHVILKMQESGPTVCSPFSRRLERLTICTCTCRCKQRQHILLSYFKTECWSSLGLEPSTGWRSAKWALHCKTFSILILVFQQTAAASAATMAIPENLSQIQQGVSSHGKLIENFCFGSFW